MEKTQEYVKSVFEKWSKKGRISNRDSAETLKKEGVVR